MPVYFDKQKQRWRFTFNRIIRGRRHRASKLLPAAWDRAKAEKYDRKETGDLYAAATGIESRARLIDHAVELYLKHRIPKQRAGRKAAHHLAALIDYYEGRAIEDLPDVALEVVEADHGWSKGTVHNRLQYLKAACRYAWRRHWRTGPDPTSAMMIPSADNERHVYLTVAQLRKLLAKFDDREAADLFKMAFYTGLRWMADLYPRKPEDVRRLGGVRWLYVGMTKNGTPRMVPIHRAILPCLKRLPFKRPAREYYAAFERARKRAGMTHVVAHDLRHSLASAIVSTGGTLVDVQAALHHKSAASAKRYAHLYDKRLRKVMMGIGK